MLKKIVGTSVLTIALISPFGLEKPSVVSAASCSYTQTWDLVDSGKHLDWEGSSIFMSQFKQAIPIWEAIPGGVDIRPDSATVIEDVYVSDYSKAGTSTLAYTSSSGVIKFNKTTLGAEGSSTKLNVAIHELGHAQRLDHSTSTQIMYKYATTKTTLGTTDKSVYNCNWN